MYTLFCSPNSYAMTVHAVLEDIGVDYDVRWVTLFEDSPDPEFLAVSPHARVPALTGGDQVLFETGAIAMFLAERHAPQLLISVEHPARGRFLQWFHYLASTLQPDVMLQFHPEFYADNDVEKARVQQASMQRLTRVLKIVDDALEPGPYFFGDQVTICDFLLCMQAVWPEIYPRDISEFPHIERLVNAMRERDSVRRVLEVHKDPSARMAAKG